MCNEHLKVLTHDYVAFMKMLLIIQALRESWKTTVLNEWERTCLPPQNEKVSQNSYSCIKITLNISDERTFLFLWDTLLSEMIDKARVVSVSSLFIPV